MQRRGLLQPVILDPCSECERTSFLLAITDGASLEVLTQDGKPFTAEQMIFYANRQVEVRGNENGNVFQLLEIQRVN